MGCKKMDCFDIEIEHLVDVWQEHGFPLSCFMVWKNQRRVLDRDLKVLKGRRGFLALDSHDQSGLVWFLWRSVPCIYTFHTGVATDVCFSSMLDSCYPTWTNGHYRPLNIYTWKLLPLDFVVLAYAWYISVYKWACR